MIDLPVLSSPPGLEMRLVAQEFIRAYDTLRGADQRRVSLPRVFSLCRALELAGKALHLHDGRTASELRQLSHDLERVLNTDVLQRHGVELDDAERKAIVDANGYYCDKGFEYPYYGKKGQVGRGLSLMFAGWPDFPDETVLRRLIDRLLAVKLE